MKCSGRAEFVGWAPWALPARARPKDPGTGRSSRSGTPAKEPAFRQNYPRVTTTHRATDLRVDEAYPRLFLTAGASPAVPAAGCGDVSAIRLSDRRPGAGKAGQTGGP